MTLPQTVVGDWRLSDEDFLTSFRLPQAEDRIDPLAALHRFPNEHRLRFDAVEHVYYFDDVPVQRSVTALVKGYATEFDARRAAEVMLASPTWPERQVVYGPHATVDSIVALWTRNGDVQRARGQLLHFQADQLCQGRVIEEPWSPELRQAESILATMASQGLHPCRSEVTLHHAGLRLAGQPDLLMSDGAGTLSVVDWKRIRALNYDCRFRSFRPPLEHLPDSNFWRYALQVNVYKYMLSCYGAAVGPMYLGVVHPELPSGRCVQVPDLEDEIAALVEAEREAGRADG
jgi:hypothetical protein